MKYTYTEEETIWPQGVIKIIRRSDGACIPMDEFNSDYQTYLRWVENPNAPEFQTPWVEPQLTK